MRKLIVHRSMLIVLFVIAVGTQAQSISKDSLYLNQFVPGSDPKAFNLKVTHGTFAAERIAISMDYSDVHIYWVNMGNMVDSMKNTNLPPYVRNKPKPQTATVGKMFSCLY